MKSVLFVAAEGLPYIKTGGLADVIGSLPKILNEKGMDARVVLPLYKRIAEKYRGEFTKLKTIPIHVGVIDTVATIYQSQWENVTYYFIEHAGYFERDGLYGYPDDGERFAFYQKAVLEMLWAIDFFPDIMHCHDWHTGMIAAMCHIQYPDDQRYQQIKHMYTIHNLAFQGNFPADVLTDCLGIDRRYFDDGSMRFHNGISFMKTGIIFSDKITTVSPSYSQEILTAQYGEQMDEVLRFRRHRHEDVGSDDRSGAAGALQCGDRTGRQAGEQSRCSERAGPAGGGRRDDDRHRFTSDLAEGRLSDH